MKRIQLNWFLVAFMTMSLAVAQTTNSKNGIAASGYDVVAYFSNKAVKGEKKLSYSVDEVEYRFSSEENLKTFKTSPENFMPEYGGYCAYAIADSGKKVGINPKTFKIQDGKLYLFYNSWGVNTLKKWNEEGPQRLQKKADDHWKEIKAYE